jgi:acetyl-CoA synthetase
MSKSRRLLPDSRNYPELYKAFEWPTPDRFNIAREICDRWAKAEPDRVAIIHKTPQGPLVHISYGALYIRANRLANALRSFGISKRDRVALLLPQCPQTSITHIAAYKLGAVAVPLASLFGHDALEYRLNNSGARAIITDSAGLTKINAIRERLEHLDLIICIDGAEGEAQDFDGFCEGQSEEFETEDTAIEDWAVMVYTSGTTGPPKGALHAQRVLLGHLPGVEFSHDFFPQEGDLMWTPADWAWAGGLFNIMFPALYYGVPLLACTFTKFDPEEVFALMEEAGVRNVFIPPTALRMLRAVENPSQRFKLSLRTIASGGETLGRETLAWGRDELGLTINEFYGQTECNYVLASCAAIGVVKPGSIGKAVPGHVVGIIDEAGNELGTGEQGQIAIKRPDPNMFLEYWQRPDASEEKFIGDWMTTGDQGMIDEDGYVSFVGRDDDVITSAGYRIGPGEIEDCLIKHPAVHLAAAVGIPDPVRTEIVKAFIVLKEGFEQSPELEKELGAFVREHLSAHEYPREIAFIDEMPLTTTGKIIRRLLRDQT